MRVLLAATVALGMAGLFPAVSGLGSGHGLQFAAAHAETAKAGQGWESSGGEEQITICHGQNTLSIGRSAVSAHIPGHGGDYMGECVSGGGKAVCVSLDSLNPSVLMARSKQEANLVKAGELEATARKLEAYRGLSTVPCTLPDGQPGVWADSVSGMPSAGPAVSRTGSFREMRGK